ncbi:MAG: hypothetical protein LBR05_00535 [Azoarcus sp.]|jgi:hypothetical protein|nr:hypothetical protein [Azoarcus sp.]
MAKIICVLGNKGGTGKTTLSHMLCQGLGLLGHRAACILTDVSREPLSPNGRRYITADARNADALTKVIDKLRSLDDWIGVVDGAGNRTDMDRKLYALADIVLLPFRDSHEDIRTVVRDLDMFPRAYAVPAQWPGNPWQRDAADRNVARLMGDFRHRILKPVVALSSSKLLLQKQVPEQMPSPLNRGCRALAREVLDVMEIDVDHDEDEGDADAPEMAVPAGRLPAAEIPLRLHRAG